MQLTDADGIRKCVVYVGYLKDDFPKIGGTAFFVHYKSKYYLVTAKHNLLRAQQAGAAKLLLRFNTKDGGLGTCETDFAAWKHHDDQFTDVAVMRVIDEIEKYSMDVLAYPAANFADSNVIADTPITVGDEIFCPGLFSVHAGDVRNVPIVRSGNIAAMAEEPVKITWFDNSKVLIDAYLIEARSIGGLSGSPVFVHHPWRKRVREEDGKIVIKLVAKPTEHCLLGLVHGHYDESLYRAKEDDSQYINLGIAIVVPFEKVLEVLDVL